MSSKIRDKKTAGRRPSWLRRRWQQMDAPGRRALGRCVAWAVIGVAAIAGAAYGMKTLEQHVLRGTDGPAAPVVRVALANPPDWMPASQVRWLAARLTEQAIQFNAPGLTGAVCAAADRLPQVRTVHRVIKRLSADGRVGRVDEFLVDATDGHITHLVLREGHLWGQKNVLIPVSQIERVEEETIYLKLDKRAIESLPIIPIRRPTAMSWMSD